MSGIVLQSFNLVGHVVRGIEIEYFKITPGGSGAIFAEFNPATEMAKKIDFENGDFREFKRSATLTLTLNHLENHIVQFVSSTSIHITTVHMAFIEFDYEWTDGRTYQKCKFWGHVAHERDKNSEI